MKTTVVSFVNLTTQKPLFDLLLSTLRANAIKIHQWFIFDYGEGEDENPFTIYEEESTPPFYTSLHYRSGVKGHPLFILQRHREQIQGDIIIFMNDDGFYPLNYIKKVIEHVRANQTKTYCYMDVLQPQIYDYEYSLAPWVKAKPWMDVPIIYINLVLITRKLPSDRTFQQIIRESSGPLQMSIHESGVLLTTYENRAKYRYMYEEETFDTTPSSSIQERIRQQNTLWRGYTSFLRKSYQDTLADDQALIHRNTLVYYCGEEPVTEQLLELISYLKQDKDIVVYCYPVREDDDNKVTFKRTGEFRMNEIHYNCLVIYKHQGFFPLFSRFRPLIKADKVILELSGSRFPVRYINYPSNISVIDEVVVYNQERADYYRALIKKPTITISVIPVGITQRYFEYTPMDALNNSRHGASLYHFICNHNINRIVTHLWPLIRQENEEARLDLCSEYYIDIGHCYGVSMQGKLYSNARFANLKKQAGWDLQFMDQPFKNDTEFSHIYESYLTGCIPLMLGCPGFLDKPGIVFPNITDLNAESAPLLARLIKEVIDMRLTIISFILSSSEKQTFILCEEPSLIILNVIGDVQSLFWEYIAQQWVNKLK